MGKINKFFYKINNREDIYANAKYQLYQLENTYKTQLFTWSEIVEFVQTLWGVNIEDCPEISVDDFGGTPIDMINLSYILTSPEFELGEDYVPFENINNTIGVLLNPNSKKTEKLLQYLEEHPLLDKKLYKKLFNLTKQGGFVDFVKYGLRIDLTMISPKTFEMLNKFYRKIYDKIDVLNNFQFEYEPDDLRKLFYEFLQKQIVTYY